MVGELDTEQTILFNTLMGKASGAEYTHRGDVPGSSESGTKRGASILLKSSKCKIDIDTSGKVPSIHIKLEYKASLDEGSGVHNLNRQEVKKELEEAVSAEIKGGQLKLLNYMKSVGADPVGFGEIVRAKHNQYWKSVNWKEVYKDARFDVEVKMNLESYGVIK
jgi:spore germination protein